MGHKETTQEQSFKDSKDIRCSSNEDCTNDPLLHCPSHHKHCRDTKCYCVHGNHGHGK
uniref:Uncharacterized protein n=1 Tax=Magallana gigas TaxID=29159 RepID=K1PRY9_MAGGI